LLGFVREYLGDEAWGPTGSYADFAKWCAEDDSRPGGFTIRYTLGKWSDVKARATS
jgi:hypothetical protein